MRLNDWLRNCDTGYRIHVLVQIPGKRTDSLFFTVRTTPGMRGNSFYEVGNIEKQKFNWVDDDDTATKS